MKFLIHGDKLRDTDKKLLQEFCQYTLDITKAKDRPNAWISIRFLGNRDVPKSDRPDLKRFLTWMEHRGNDHFVIVINKNVVRKHNNQMKRLAETFECLGHELVHVKQYLNREMRDLEDDKVWFKGKVYKNWTKNEDYYFSPWEIEAYGHEVGLRACFKKRKSPK